MRYTESKHFVKSKSIEDSSISSVASDFVRVDDDPLSIKKLSTTFLGLIIAFMTILLPLLSVYFARPSFQENEIIINQSLKKDGS